MRTHQSWGVLWSLARSRVMQSSSSGPDVLKSCTCSSPLHALSRPQITLSTVLMLHTHPFLPHSPSTLSFPFSLLLSCPWLFDNLCTDSSVAGARRYYHQRSLCTCFLPLEVLSCHRLERKSKGDTSKQNTMSECASARFRVRASWCLCICHGCAFVTISSLFNCFFLTMVLIFSYTPSNLCNILKPRRGHRTPVRMQVYMYKIQFVRCNLV